MSGELSAVRETASERPSKVTQSLVERLRQQLSVKEKQQKVGGLGFVHCTLQL